MNDKTFDYSIIEPTCPAWDVASLRFAKICSVLGPDILQECQDFRHTGHCMEKLEIKRTKCRKHLREKF